MKNLKLVLCAGMASMGLAYAGGAFAQAAPAPAAAPTAPAAPAANPPPYPSMSATLSANPNPAVFDAGPLGKLMVTGVLSGGGFYQTNPIPDYSFENNNSAYGDLTNALVMVQKTDGPIQFFVAAGAYSLAALGAPYLTSVVPQDPGDHDAPTEVSSTFGVVPEAFVKIVPNSNWSIMIGSLPTVVGDEYTFSFQNMNIQRGLLWSQENVFDKGIQVNYSNGPWAVSVSWNDGFDSDQYNNISGSVGYTFKNSDTLVFAATAPIGMVGTVASVDNSFSGSGQRNFFVPPYQSNSTILNLIYTHTQGPWTISPYFQYTSVPSNAVTQEFCLLNNGSVPCAGSGSTYAGAILMKYSVTPEFSLAFRAEYEGSSGTASLLYGPGSNAWSITFTPTYQKGIFFVRGEVSYTAIGSGTPGFMFGPSFTAGDQTRVAGEAGVMF